MQEKLNQFPLNIYTKNETKEKYILSTSDVTEDCLNCLKKMVIT